MPTCFLFPSGLPPDRGHRVRAGRVGRRGGEGGEVRGRHAEVPHEGAPGAARRGGRRRQGRQVGVKKWRQIQLKI